MARELQWPGDDGHGCENGWCRKRHCIGARVRVAVKRHRFGVGVYGVIERHRVGARVYVEVKRLPCQLITR